MQHLEHKLRELGRHTSWQLSERVRTETHNRLLALDANAARTSYAFVDALVRVPRELTELVARPLAFASLMVVMVLGGWMTSVNASLDTVPGDRFYPVKLATERAQLSIAGNEARQKLRAEFTTRRLNEVSTLIEANAEGKGRHIQQALDGFAKQIEAVEDDLAHTTDPKEQVNLARIIDDSQSQLERILLAPESVKDEANVEVLTASQKVADAAKTKAVETLEGSAILSETPANELARQFTKELRGIRGEREILLDRLAAVERTRELYNRQDVALPSNDVLFELKTIDLSGAENFAANGGYRRAFELTASVRKGLRVAELELARAEIALTQPAPVSDVVPAENVQTEVVPETNCVDACESETHAADDIQATIEVRVETTPTAPPAGSEQP
ncbi:hypothetical protein HYV72_01220 [Candidatus Uhrbacteria bacterium]|nr:hypothetical protein [Candidatus Uhrbacteria bacterium]